MSNFRDKIAPVVFSYFAPFIVLALGFMLFALGQAGGSINKPPEPTFEWCVKIEDTGKFEDGKHQFKCYKDTGNAAQSS